ncbi:MAG: hypothetical protein M3Q56_06565, partial [Bacteroidota bacterium]|nr:hypothetical protein [Bacteroidota bacterium]
PKALEQWNLKKVNQCQLIQKNLLYNCSQILQDGGIIIYSTCTFNKLENEEVINNVLKDNTLETYKLDFPESIPVRNSDYLNIPCYRCFPHKMSGEGFSVTLLKKPGIQDLVIYQPTTKYVPFEKIPKDLMVDDTLNIYKNPKDEIYASTTSQFELVTKLHSQKLGILNVGLTLGLWKGKDWFPHHALSQSQRISPTIPRLELSYTEALNYLRAHSPTWVKNVPDQWQISIYKNARLGWVKQIQQSFKNYLPKELRILNL